MARKGDGTDQAKVGDRTRLCTTGGLVLVLSLLLLYVASAGSAPSAANLTTRQVTFESPEPATWQQLLKAGSVLQGRLRASPPGGEASLKWTVQSGHLVIAHPSNVPFEWLAQEAQRRGSVELVEGGTEFLPVGRRVQTGPVPRPDRGIYEVVLSPVHFLAASARMHAHRPAVEFLLTPEGDEQLAAHTERHNGYYLCLLIDNEVVNCPLLRTPLTERSGVMELTGNATLEQARLLATLLLSGPLPVTLRRVGSAD